MNRNLNKIAVVVGIAVVGVFYFYARKDLPDQTFNATQSQLEPEQSVDGPQRYVVETEDGQASKGLVDQGREVAGEQTTDSDDFADLESVCKRELNEAFMELVRHDDDRLSKIRLHDLQFMQSYRGLSTLELQDLSAQGDGDAMFALGLAVLMEELGVDGRLVVPAMLGETHFEQVDSLEDKLTIDGAKKMSGPLYDAAVHGKLFVIPVLASLYGEVGFTPVDLGWLDASDWVAPDDAKETRRQIRDVYAAMLTVVLPESLPSTTDETYREWESRAADDLGDLWDAAVIPLSEKFLQDLSDRQLSLPELAPRKNMTDYVTKHVANCTPEMLEASIYTQ